MTSLCPRCRVNRLEKYPALSRTDNKTEICGQCGMDEALTQFRSPDHTVSPQSDWPVMWTYEFAAQKPD